MTHWTRSTFCSGADCVEVAFTPTGVHLRDSKNPQQQPLDFTLPAWRAFLAAAAAAGQYTPDRKPNPLTSRQQQVLTLMARGLTNDDIGRELYISRDTVATIRKRLFERLGVANRAAAVQRGWELGLLGPTTAPLAPRRTA